MLLPAYVILLLAKRKLARCWHEVRTLRGGYALAFLLLQLRSYVVAGIGAFILVFSVLVWTQHGFVGITLSEDSLNLEYPWPRPNVQLSWGDVARTVVDKKSAGILRVTRFSLRVETSSAIFRSPWSANPKVLAIARDAIETHLVR